MIIKKFQGSTEEEAIEKAKEELGNSVVIMNTKIVKPKGIFRFFKSSSIELTAAVDKNESAAVQTAVQENANNTEEKIIEKEPVNEHKSIDTVSVSEKTAEIKTDKPSAIEERLENLQQLLEKQLGTDKEEKKTEKEDFEKVFENQEEKKSKKDNLSFIKLIYRVMLENEIDEKYVNQIIDETEQIMKSDKNVDYILSNIYQKMVLKFGQSKAIELTEKKPNVIFFVGPTGVGKTTTIAKLASKLKLEENKKIALITADTYRIAATEQLRTYANILDLPFTVIYSHDELSENINNFKEYDAILIDTAGHSHRNEEQQTATKELLNIVDEKYSKEVYLVLSATTKYKDLLEIVDAYSGISDYRIIFTKLDETSTYGNILNIKLHSGAMISYITNGQNVPDDIEIFKTQRIVKKLLGGR